MRAEKKTHMLVPGVRVVFGIVDALRVVLDGAWAYFHTSARGLTPGGEDIPSSMKSPSAELHPGPPATRQLQSR